MTQTPSSNNKKPDQPDQKPLTDSSLKPSRRIPLWQVFVLPLASILIFFLLLEGGLALFGVKPALKTEDPFVGFASNVPLFVPAPGPGGRQVMTTATNKLNNFNQQSFPLEKAPGTFRIFCLGGSTTYGRPYNDITSFAGWLRELLPAADRNKNWEVINAGGISYASYRAAHLMEELINYQPDLFIIYTGHNEFLEERTYSKIKDIPPVIRTSVSLLAKTRTWSAMTSALQGLGLSPQQEKQDRENLALEVVTILDKSAGLNRYTRDDALQEKILRHYRVSLERMAGMARSVGAKVIFVTPASSLNDCTPFKSEHTPDISPADSKRTEEVLAQAKTLLSQKSWHEAATLLEAAVKRDPRHAELQYRYGQALLALERYAEAESAFRAARDEDVCPLRALTPMRKIVADVAKDQGAGHLDYVDLLERSMQQLKGYSIPGKEFFLDHVHPTIEGNKILAVGLVKAMADTGLVRLGTDWGDQAIASVAAKIEGRIDRETHGQALANLARVLLWARKFEDAARLANQAQDIAGDYLQVAVDSASVLSTVYLNQGQPQRTVDLLHSSIEKAPGAVELRLKLGATLLDSPFLRLEEAAAHLLLTCQQLPYFDDPFAFFGVAMAKRGRTRIAYSSLMEALRLNPTNALARSTLAQIKPYFKGQLPDPRPPEILLDIYPSITPRLLVQVRRDPQGRPIRDGIEVEFYENGRVKRFLDLDWGVPNGVEIIWDKEGRQLSRKVYRQGKLVEGEGN
ncbi:MAG: hypothetical protein AMJ61_15365 [Desulfobacterales bacterium SG8_35_2]|nr:MAG: hypothetical protein AMJ61_15365 [Desulfobacterales bacterium SG8_35_2]